MLKQKVKIKIHIASKGISNDGYSVLIYTKIKYKYHFNSYKVR